MFLYFRDLDIDTIFQTNKYDKTQWIKVSSRTAREVNSSKRYYFRIGEPVYVRQDSQVSIDSNGYYIGDYLTPKQEKHNLNIDKQIGG